MSAHRRWVLLYLATTLRVTNIYAFSTLDFQSKLWESGSVDRGTCAPSLHMQLNSQNSELSESSLFKDDVKVDRKSFSEKVSMSRRKAMVAAMAGLNAEAAWNTAVAMASEEGFSSQLTSSSLSLPSNTIEQLEAGRAVIVPNWLPLSEVRALRQDAKDCFQSGQFTNFILSRNPNKADKAANDRWIMPSFSPKYGVNEGPFANPSVGSYTTRNLFKAKMAQVKAYLSKELQGRPTLADVSLDQTHEMEYLRYGEGAFLQRHTDEHHVELKRPNGSRLPKKPNASRRSVTWMVYLNEDWDTNQDGGQLRLHERQYPSISKVGSMGNDLQVGWLKATTTTSNDILPEQPVFLDPFMPGPENENCILYTVNTHTNQRRNLSSKPFANIALYLGGGDGMARKLMVDSPTDAARLHLIDAPKSLVSTILPKGKADQKDYTGEDGGEKVRDISPQAGTLVMFDSVSLPHEVLVTNQERFGIQGWFHEKLGYT